MKSHINQSQSGSVPDGEDDRQGEREAPPSLRITRMREQRRAIEMQ